MTNFGDILLRHSAATRTPHGNRHFRKVWLLSPAEIITEFDKLCLDLIVADTSSDDRGVLVGVASDYPTGINALQSSQSSSKWNRQFPFLKSTKKITMSSSL